MAASFRINPAFVILVLGIPLRAAADPQSERTIAMEEVRMATQAEVLAAGCGLHLNVKLRDMLWNDASIRLSPEAFSGVEQFTRAYTLNLLRRHPDGICTHALEQFGLEGKQMQGLLSER
jgi:hypothetical protein